MSQQLANKLASELAQMKRISERQSKMLAAALREKNDLLFQQENGYKRSSFYENKVKELQAKLTEAEERAAEIRKAARVMWRALGL